MEYKPIRCPYCGLELQVPVGIEQVVCMYCAKPIDITALFAPTAAEPDGGKRLQQALSLLDPALFRFEAEEPAFTQKNYPDCFASYNGRLSTALEALQGVQDEDCQAFAQALLSRMTDDLHYRKVHSSKSAAFFRYRMMVAVYLIPALHDSTVPEAAIVLRAFLQLWNSKYPKEALNPVSFEKINGGWRRKGCYITTAVCHSLHKSDDCTELQTLRRFRDSWMLRQPEGPLLIQEYYTFAPSIVAAINIAPNPERIYRSLWQNCISPCMQEAAAGQNQSCLQRYTEMMLSLEQQYLS